MSLYEACDALFAAYPVAITPVDQGGTVRSMVLLLREGDREAFFVLSRDGHGGRSEYSFFPWRGGNVVDIASDSVPDFVVNAIFHGVPIPRDGSMFGWVSNASVTALIPVYATYNPDTPVPSWSVMPRTGSPGAVWPPFTDERLFGPWFWEHYHASNIISVGSLIGRNPETAFWVDTDQILGSDCCVVVRDLRSPEGPTLRRGSYVYHEALRAGRPVPSLEVLLAEADKIDLAPRFGSSASEDCLQGGR